MSAALKRLAQVFSASECAAPFSISGCLPHDPWPSLANLAQLTLQVSEPVNACSFAAGVSSTESGLTMPVGAFQGQAGCLYLFNDVLNPGTLQDASLEANSSWQLNFL